MGELDEPAMPGQVPVAGDSQWRLPDPATIARSSFRSARTRANLLIGLLWLSLAASVFASAIDLWGFQTVDAYLANRATSDDLDSFDLVFGLSGLADSVIFLITAVTWLAWQSRTVDNESSLVIGPSPWTPRWSMGWWFVPFANLYQPYRIMRDIYRRHHAGDRTDIGLVKLWWALWLVMNLTTNAAGRLWLGLDTLDELQDGLVIWLVADIASIVLVFPAVRLVRSIQDRADRIALDRSSSPTPGLSETVGSPA